MILVDMTMVVGGGGGKKWVKAVLVVKTTVI